MRGGEYGERSDVSSIAVSGLDYPPPKKKKEMLGSRPDLRLPTHLARRYCNRDLGALQHSKEGKLIYQHGQ